MRNAKSSPFAVAVIAAGVCASSSVGLAQSAPCKSLQTLSGGCAERSLIERSQKRSLSISSARTSYQGSAVADVGEPGIPYNRLLRGDLDLYGLPTITTTTTGPIGSPGMPVTTTYKRSK
jgi:hypothetical protein